MKLRSSGPRYLIFKLGYVKPDIRYELVFATNKDKTSEEIALYKAR
jgi:hypothetical protein